MFIGYPRGSSFELEKKLLSLVAVRNSSGRKFAQVLDLSVTVARLENCAAGHKSVSAEFSNPPNVGFVDSAVNLQPKIQAGFVDVTSGLRDFFKGGLDESLTSESGLYGHNQKLIKLVELIKVWLKSCAGLYG
jgi:hypothetical protein